MDCHRVLQALANSKILCRFYANFIQILCGLQELFGFGFPRNGGRPGIIRDVTSRCAFVPGQKHYLVPLSWDKLFSPGTSWDKTTFWLAKKMSKKSKIVKKNNQNCNLFTLFSLCPVAKCQNPVLALSGPWQVFDLVPFSLSPGTMKGHLSCCVFVLGQWRDFCPFVPQDKKIPSCWNP